MLVRENKPSEISRILSAQGMETEILLKRQARNEGLMVMRIKWKKEFISINSKGNHDNDGDGDVDNKSGGNNDVSSCGNGGGNG